MKIKSLGDNYFKVTTDTDDLSGHKISLRVWARKPRAKSDAEIVITPNPYSTKINNQVRDFILDYLEGRNEFY